MEISDLISLSDSTKTMRRSVGSTLLWGHRTALADSSREHFQTLCYAKHAYNTILLGSDHIWAKDLRVIGTDVAHVLFGVDVFHRRLPLMPSYRCATQRGKF